jgi:hypothetical protein
MNSSGKFEHGIDTNGGSRPSKTKMTRLVGSIERGKDASSRLKSLGLARRRRGYAMMVSMFLVVCAASVVIVSAVALTGASQSTLSTKAPPGTPHPVFGYTYDTDGVTPIPACDVIITDLTTMEQIVTTSSDPEGIYSVDLSELTLGWVVGDILNVTATKGSAVGWSEAPITDTPSGYDQIDVTLSGTAIPEFPMVIMPVVGMIALFAVVSLKRRTKVQ